MPALPPVPNVVRYDFLYTLGPNSSILNRLFFRYTGTVSAADAATLVGTAAAAWNTNVMPQLTTTCTHTSTTITDLNSATGVQATSLASAAGSLNTADAAAGTAMVVELEIARRYRGGKAKIFLPGMTSAKFASVTRWLPAYVTAVQNAVASAVQGIALLPPAAVGTMNNVAVSYYSGFTPTTPPPGVRVRNKPNLRATPLVDLVTTFEASAKIGSQRRRNQVSA